MLRVSMGLTSEWLLAVATILTPPLGVVTAEQADEPLHAPTKEHGSKQEPPVPRNDGQHDEAGGDQVIYH